MGGYGRDFKTLVSEHGAGGLLGFSGGLSETPSETAVGCSSRQTRRAWSCSKDAPAAVASPHLGRSEVWKVGLLDTRGPKRANTFLFS